MENASKALLMAGAVLLSILLLALLLYFFNQPKVMINAINQRTEAKNLQKFNAQYEAFNRNVLYGVDMISVVNKMVDHNAKNPDKRLEIDVIITTPEKGTAVLLEGRYRNVEELNDYIKDLNEETEKNKLEAIAKGQTWWDDTYTQFKSSTFRCTGIEYDKETTRVKRMSFKFVKLGTGKQ